ncbi:MAG: peptidylprolyl isomerase [Burkholderiales bacterium]|nr:peptidylprolyl isomerase [Burkholderiales bacterium]
MFIKSRILLVSAVSLLALSACGSDVAVPAAGTAKHSVAATVNGAPISESMLDMMLKQRSNLGREASAEARKSFIDRLAMQLIIAQEAVKKGFDKKPEVMDRIELGRQSVLVDAFVQDYYKNNPVTDDMLNAEYEKMKAQESGTEYKARHILVETEAEAKEIIAKLNKNASAFEELAKEKSRDTGSKVKGGELGWFDPRGMVPEFAAAVVKLAKGKFTEEPVKTQFGYHVILLEDTRPKSAPPLEQVKEQLVQHLKEQNLRKFLEEMKAKAKIEIVESAAPAAAQAPQAKPAEPTGK